MRRRGYTLVEILTATLITMGMMMAVVEVFATIGKSVTDSRAIMEIQVQLRTAGNRLKQDLGSATTTMNPPRDPGTNEGYLEIVEGPLGPLVDPGTVGADTLNGNAADSSLGDCDDVLKFTLRSAGTPFIGRCTLIAGGLATSPDAEVIWFVRGRKLYRRLLLVMPELNNPATYNLPGRPAAFAAGFYANNDISVRRIDAGGGVFQLWANSMGDLTNRQNRFAHTGLSSIAADFPFDARRWGQLGMPTHRECSHVNWIAGGVAPFAPAPWTQVDLWNPLVPVSVDHSPALWPTAGATGVEPTTLTAQAYYDPVSARIAEDVLLNNVIGFDVKVWDPYAPIVSYNSVTYVPGDPGYLAALVAAGPAGRVSYGAYVDLNYMCRLGPESSPSPTDFQSPHPAYINGLQAGERVPWFFGAGDRRSRLRGHAPSATPTWTTWNAAAVYDTGSNSYEGDTVDQGNYISGVTLADEGTNGFDDDGANGIDDPGELEAPVPYPRALRGIQIKIRVFEPDTKQIREVTVVQQFGS